MLIDWWDVVWVASEVTDSLFPDGHHAQRREATARTLAAAVNNFDEPFDARRIHDAMHGRFPRRRIEPVLRMWLRDGRIERIKRTRPRQYRKSVKW